MWPLSKCRIFESPDLNDKVRRYRSHLATLTPERLKLFEIEDCTKGPLLEDLLQTTKQFARDVVGHNPRVEEVRPGIGRSVLSIDVMLRPGIDPQDCQLPEFYQGYMVNPTPRPILPGNRE